MNKIPKRNMEEYFIDSHCHLHQPWFEDDISDVLKRASDNNVKKVVNCSSNPKSFNQVLDTNKFSEISVTLGLQPTLASQLVDADSLRKIENLNKQIVAIGEVGLDYYWVKENKLQHNQELLFIDCINLSEELNLPLVVHSRKAETEVLVLLEKHASVAVLLHSFDGNLKQIERAIDLGFLISIPTILIRRKNRRKVALRAGLDNLVIETDSPFCATSPEIQRNEPKYISEAGLFLATLFESNLEEIASVTTKNAEGFYKI